MARPDSDFSADPQLGDVAVRTLGDFELIEELGRGGMGVVYRARQLSLDREVAVKVLPSLASMNPGAVERFRREAEACARLSHPGIVAVHGVGEVGGDHYFAMELVEGPSFADLLDQRDSPNFGGDFVVRKVV